jgi:hypothetical protein
VRFRVPLMHDFEAIRIDLDELSPCDLAGGCSQARRLYHIRLDMRGETKYEYLSPLIVYF